MDQHPPDAIRSLSLEREPTSRSVFRAEAYFFSYDVFYV